MRLSNIPVNIFLSIFLIFIFTGCFRVPASYEVFEYHRNYNSGGSFIPNVWGEKHRQIYSEDKYIYTGEHPKGCINGFFTNRDDKPERTLGWLILNGEEHCKEQRGWALM